MSEIIELQQENSFLGHILYELRHEEIQLDAYRFRQNLENAGFIMAYEISKALRYKSELVKTPLGEAHVNLLNEKLVLATMLRASIPMSYGFSKVFREAESAFLGVMRKELEGEDVDANVSYIAAPDLQGKTLLMIDPMLATGTSLVKSYQNLTFKNKPKNCIIACLFGTQVGIDMVNEHIETENIYVGVIDGRLNDKSYIVPGLGDAGDLAFGEKI